MTACPQNFAKGTRDGHVGAKSAPLLPSAATAEPPSRHAQLAAIARQSVAARSASVNLCDPSWLQRSFSALRPTQPRHESAVLSEAFQAFNQLRRSSLVHSRARSLFQSSRARLYDTQQRCHQVRPDLGPYADAGLPLNARRHPRRSSLASSPNPTSSSPSTSSPRTPKPTSTPSISSSGPVASQVQKAQTRLPRLQFASLPLAGEVPTTTS
ncbi:hypothetical protein DFH06DRAFT_1465045 [Mycena polygramma]|nr:hypothetical protein DFH06DRAFT_1465045 [Mycena polygramma]